MLVVRASCGAGFIAQESAQGLFSGKVASRLSTDRAVEGCDGACA